MGAGGEHYAAAKKEQPFRQSKRTARYHGIFIAA
jgi:hypothetical protein